MIQFGLLRSYPLPETADLCVALKKLRTDSFELRCRGHYLSLQSLDVLVTTGDHLG